MRARNLPEAEIRRRLDAIFNGRSVCVEDRRYALALRGVSHQRIAYQLGTAYRSSLGISQVISGERVGRRERAAIVALVGVPEERFWPGEESVRSLTCKRCGEDFQTPRAPGPPRQRCDDCLEVPA